MKASLYALLLLGFILVASVNVVSAALAVAAGTAYFCYISSGRQWGWLVVAIPFMTWSLRADWRVGVMIGILGVCLCSIDPE